MVANWPYTLLGIMPTNNRRMAADLASAGSETRKLIETWAGLHAARTALGFAATLVFLWALMHSAVREIRDVGFVGQLIAGDPQAPNVLEHSLTARLVTVTDNG